MIDGCQRSKREMQKSYRAEINDLRSPLWELWEPEVRRGLQPKIELGFGSESENRIGIEIKTEIEIRVHGEIGNGTVGGNEIKTE
ncbi:hypothetical protein EVAR_77277_1 [Eumeta japonica]|uniref:Uncharacterized protein n=1 Tax=Eumeta variegata TaxID=151549 RepID=A0A4C1ULB8_EUMVA|nr:hypothetical protein EVAR_77277_1 [Eumeta japonica]